jgi:hypothetical protein
MRLLRWSAIAVAAALMLSLSGCALFDFDSADMKRAVDAVRTVPGVSAETHVSLAGVRATIVVPATDSAASFLAVRNRIVKRLKTVGETNKVDYFTLARGVDRISLAATPGQFAYLERLRNESPAIGVHLNANPLDIESPTVNVIVANKADVVAGFDLVQTTVSDPAIDANYLKIGSETPDGRYELSNTPTFGQLDYIPLANQLFADPKLVGAKLLDPSEVFGPTVSVRVRTQAEVPAAWVHYDTVMDSYRYNPLEGVDAPHLRSWDDDTPTDGELKVLTVAIAAGVINGEVDMRNDLNDRGQIAFVPSSLANAKKLNGLALAHPEFRKEIPGGFRVDLLEGSEWSRWNFGKPTTE